MAAHEEESSEAMDETPSNDGTNKIEPIFLEEQEEEGGEDDVESPPTSDDGEEEEDDVRL